VSFEPGNDSETCVIYTFTLTTCVAHLYANILFLYRICQLLSFLSLLVLLSVDRDWIMQISHLCVCLTAPSCTYVLCREKHITSKTSNKAPPDQSSHYNTLPGTSINYRVDIYTSLC